MRGAVLLVLVFLCAGFARAQTLTLYAGQASTKTQLFGATLGGEIWKFLQLQVDFFKYIKYDEALHSDDPLVDRGDMYALSGNLALRLPIHLIPIFAEFDFFQPYILAGYGVCLESWSSEFFKLPDLNDKSGILTKLRQFDVLGAGLVLKITPGIGIKLDYRHLDIHETSNLGLPKREFNRYSIGLCF